jgi:hypothetical protein
VARPGRVLMSALYATIAGAVLAWWWRATRVLGKGLQESVGLVWILARGWRATRPGPYASGRRRSAPALMATAVRPSRDLSDTTVA